MKSGKLILATLLVTLAIPVSLAAQEHPTKHHKYNLVDVGTLGGPNVWFAFAGPTSLLGSNGTVTAGADTSIVDPICWNGPDCFLMHGFKWQEECEENPGNSAPATWSPTMIPDSPLSPFRVPLIRGYRTSGGGG